MARYRVTIHRRDTVFLRGDVTFDAEDEFHAREIALQWMKDNPDGLDELLGEFDSREGRPTASIGEPVT